jgi:curli biogenesis system outer membrane secretion channel CsgG
MKTLKTNDRKARRSFLIAAAAAPSFFAPAWAKAGKADASRAVLAVMAFDYSGKDAALEPLAQGLAQMLISDLSTVGRVQVVERAKLQELLKEQKLAGDGRVDARTAARIGKLLGARYLVLGSYFDLMKQMRIDARLVEVETGKVLASVGQAGSADDFWTLESEIAKKLSTVLDTALPPSAATPMPSGSSVPRPKVNSKSAAIYGRALTALDKGDKREARTLLEQTVAENPKFTLAQADLNRLLR